MTFPALEEATAKLAAKRKELGDVFAEAGETMDLAKVKSVKGTTHDKAAWIREKNEEITEASKEYANLLAVQKAADRAKSSEDRNLDDGSAEGEGYADGGLPSRNRKSFGQLFVESKAFTGRTGNVGPEVNIDIDLKTVMTTAAGFAPEVLRNDRLVEFATRPIQVADVIPQTTTTQSAVQYMEETTFTNPAVETAEGALYLEAALAYTEQTSAVRKIPVYLPVTDEQLEDVPRMRGVIDNRLPFMIRQRLDLQIISGNGTPPNLRGVMNVVGVQTQAKAADPVPDAIYKAVVKVETIGQAVANVVIMNPTDWQGVRLLRTADGLYIWGNPSDVGPERIWGLQVVRAQAATLGTAITGDFANFSELAVRKGMDVQISNSHSDYFIRGQQAVRADMRVAFVVYRPTAFCLVTGL
jgi:HK97 family phage major capsid protein